LLMFTFSAKMFMYAIQYHKGSPKAIHCTYARIYGF
jgi:hypothetical protein